MTRVPGEAATLIWPAAGVSLAALYIYGYNLWPGVVLGTILVSQITEKSSFIAILCAALGSTLEAIIGVYLLKKTNFDKSLDRIKDVTRFIFFGVIVASTVGATIGVYGLLWSSTIHSDQFFSTWLTWWIGDALGILIYAPLILLWDGKSLRRLLHRRNDIPLFPVITFLILIILNIIVFHFLPLSEDGINPYKFLIVPIFPVIALYFGPRGNAVAMTVAFTIAIAGTVLRYTPEQSHYLSLTILQQAAGVITVSFLYITAEIAERDRAQRKLLKRTIELDKRSAHFMELNKAKDEFVSFASHQLRTPATAIKMYLGMLLNNQQGALPEQQKESVSVAYDANERQISMIQDLLTTAEIDMGNFVLAKVNTDVDHLIKEVIEQLKPVVTARRQTVIYHKAPGRYKKEIDPGKIFIVIENLINNASKYSPDGGNIYVELKQNHPNLKVEVRDNGIGIANKDAKYLFKKFSRIENELSSERGGNGLGLYIVKRIVKLHGGDISVESTPGKGTTFTVTL